MESATQIAGLETITRYTFMQRFLRESGMGEYGLATGGDTTTLIDTTKLKSTQFNDQDYVGGWGRISYDSAGAGANPQGTISPITTYVPSTGTITVNPAWAGASSVAANDYYELWRHIHPQTVLDLLDQILIEDIYVPSIAQCTSVKDGDMEQTVTTHWTGANSTLAKSTTNPISGDRHLSVLATAANGYAASTNILVQSGMGYKVGALARCGDASTSAKLVIWDNTNGAEIDSVTITSLYTARFLVDFNTPSGCKSIAIRLVTVEDTKTTYWDDVVVFRVGHKEELLPYWVRDPSQVKGVFKLTPESITTNIWSPSLRGERALEWDIQDSSDGDNRLKLVSRSNGLTQPLFIYGIKNLTAFSNDHSDTKLAPANLVLSALMVKVFSYLSTRPSINTLNVAWIASNLTRWEKKYKQETLAHSQRLEQIIQSQTPEVWITNTSSFYSPSYNNRLY